MSDPKALPKNLKKLEQQVEFKRTYKQHSANQIEDLLTEVGVDYLSADDKGDLTWRYLDYMGYDFDKQAYTKPPVSDDNIDENANKDVSDETMETNDTTAQDGNATEPGTTDGQSADSNDGAEPSASEANSKEPGQLADATDDNAAANLSDSIDTSANSAKPAPKVADTAATHAPNADHQEQSASTVKEAEHLSVTNDGDFNFYEPATGTMVKAGETAKIYTTPRADKSKITRNIDQYNNTRGKKLTIN